MKCVQKLGVLAYCLTAIVLLTGCESDLENASSPVPLEPDAGTGSGTSDFAISASQSDIVIIEGAQPTSLSIELIRAPGHRGDIVLSSSISGQSPSEGITRRFSDDTLNTNERESQLLLDLAIGALPIKESQATLTISASDSAGETSTATLTLQITPTTAPDVYLLIGQSNMVGISEDNSRLIEPGQPDEPVTSIKQLNVTGNDNTNFASPADFTDPDNLYNGSNPITVALDPLHNGLSSDGTKSGTRIGLGLSFAKQALNDTTAEIVLVPAAWSDTGFCIRDTTLFPQVGWNASPSSNTALAGTLLHDRAIARTNLALEESGGVLRGILWHQGEADSEQLACADTYADNLSAMIASLRTNINEDARGPVARGANADIPFIAGTMAKGGAQSPFPETKLIVDSVHRNLSTISPFTDFVNNDDLIPDTFPCGGGSCVHFGSAALRQMGERYYERLRSVLQ